MKKYLLLYLLPLFLYGCTDSVDELDGEGDVYGVVVESTTANPVRAAGVSLYIQDETMPSLLLKTVTYDDGHFEFNKIKSGQYILIVEMEGYEEEDMYITVEAGRTARADMQLKEIETGLTVITSAAIVDGKNVQFKGSFGYNTNANYPSEWGFVYGMERNPSLTYDEVISTTPVRYTDFEAEIQDVDKGVYYVRAYAKNRNGVSYGANLSFEVKSLPIVSTLDVTNIGDHTATLNGKIVSKGDPAYYEKGFVYSKDFPKPTIDDPSSSTKRVPVSGDSDDFSANIADLSTNSKYNVRAYAINDVETVYGDVISFVATSAPYVVIDGLAVQRSDSSNGSIWETAVDVCKQSRVGGYSDWHLPSLSELTLMYVNKDKIGNFYAEPYWSESRLWDGVYYYYAINFSSGETLSRTHDKMYRVRCVRTIN